MKTEQIWVHSYRVKISEAIVRALIDQMKIIQGAAQNKSLLSVGCHQPNPELAGETEEIKTDGATVWQSAKH